MKQMENEMIVSVPLEVVKASEIEPREVKWLWYPYIPFGKVTLLQGDPGDGKSKLKYEIVAVFRTVVYTDSPEAFKFYRFIDAESADDFVSFIAKCKELSFYDTGVTAEYGDKLITLSTCEYSRNNSRLVVVAKRIERTN